MENNIKYEVAVVVPYYHDRLSETEMISLEQCFRILYRYPIILVMPDTIDRIDYPINSACRVVKVKKQWMQSIASYNQMMLSIEFYKIFKDFKYILIYQLDAFVFRDDLRKFCDMGYDYIGAPWIFGGKYFRDTNITVRYVGNGGLSLRNVKASILMLERNPADILGMPEDVYWSMCDRVGFCVAPPQIAIQFSIDGMAKKTIELNDDKLPFGCHAWKKNDFIFWKPIIENAGYVFSKELLAGVLNDTDTLLKDIWEVPSDIINEKMNKLLSEEKQIYIWGAGAIGMRWVISFCCAGLPVRCIDSDERRWGEYIWDVCVQAPDILKIKSEKKMIIIAVKDHKEEILDRLTRTGVHDSSKVIFYMDLLSFLCSSQEKNEA